jgi:polyphosphate kinase 2 (PPK2 family)
LGWISQSAFAGLTGIGETSGHDAGLEANSRLGDPKAKFLLVDCLILLKAYPMKLAIVPSMKAKDFIVVKRPTLTQITKHPVIGFADYERRLESMQSVMQSIQQAYLGTRERAVIVVEGWDTAGKGGIVRRLGWALDPRSFKVYPIGAPLSHERGRHYLQRFWEKLPDAGQIVVFDRSWYGRVLVERVEGLASTREWHRGYDEINEFERMMVADGIRIAKCW